MTSPAKRPFVKIIEQPAERARFRYQCESYSPLLGVSSTLDEKTYPTIQIVGHQGRAVLIVSCVTKDKPYRPHPFNIDGKEGCKKGVCSLPIPRETNTVRLCNIGIKCVKKKDTVDSLKQRQELRIDPFRTGFDVGQTFDFSSVRLCFQVFLEKEKGKFTIPLPPVVSDPIQDSKHLFDLVIYKISHCVSRVDEEPEIIILCGKISKEDIQIRFYEERDAVLIWEGYGSFAPSHIHRQVAIYFKVPKYCNLQIENPVRVLLQLKRSSDGATSQSIPFEFIPSNELGKKRKMRRMDRLLDLARGFENCGHHNPFMNIKHEEASSHQNPVTPQNNIPNTLPVNGTTNALNMKPTSNFSQIPSNMPYDHTPQSVTTQHPIPHTPPNHHQFMNESGPEEINADFSPTPEPINDDIDVPQFSFAPNNNFPFNNNANGFGNLARIAMDGIYQATNNFYQQT